MNLTPASFAAFDDQAAFLDFLGQHEIAHQQINEALARQSVEITGVPLMENPKENLQWLQDHYAIHLQIATAINQTDLVDLSSVNMKNEAEYLDWMQLHAYTHEEINTLLGINT